MLQFVLGWRAAGGRVAGSAGDALGAVAGRAGLRDPARLRRWRSPDGHVALAWLARDRAQLGGVEYVHAEERRVALFAGRPVRWDAAGREADGAGPLDPRTYVAPSSEWRDALDGRWAAARYDEDARELEIGADALGAYPLFEAAAHGARWFSNAPAALSALAGARDLDPVALAGLLGRGWSLAGDPPSAPAARGGSCPASRRGRPVWPAPPGPPAAASRARSCSGTAARAGRSRAATTAPYAASAGARREASSSSACMPPSPAGGRVAMRRS